MEMWVIVGALCSPILAALIVGFSKGFLHKENPDVLPSAREPDPEDFK
jgi:hypothetical protein